MSFSQSVFYTQVKLSVLAAFFAGQVAYAQDVAVQPATRDDFVDAMLTEHNVERAKLKLNPLVWDVQLSKDANAWAEKLAAENRFEHAVEELPRKKQGENLWMGSADAYSYAEMTGLWLNEREFSKSGVFPNVSKTGNWTDVGHYSQMIWPDTQKLGCAVARNVENEFLVCRYFPAGNRIGDRLDVLLRK